MAKNYKNQILASFIINIMSFSHGISLGWLSPTLPYLQSDQTHLSSGKISYYDISWIGSLISLGGLLGNFICGYLIDKIGRKKTLCCIAIPHIIFWVLVELATHVQHLYVARFFAGLAVGGIFVTMPIFVTEIANSDIRGSLGSMMSLLMNTGIITGYILSSYLPYKIIPLAVIPLPILFIFLVLIYLPETPLYLLKDFKEREARSALKFYLNYNFRNKDSLIEFNVIFQNMQKCLLAPDGDGHNNGREKKSKITKQDLSQPDALKGLFVGMFLLFMSQCSLYTVIISYSATILEESNTKFDPYMGTIFIGATQILGTVSSILVVDTAGRKILLTISCLGVSLGLLAMGMFSYFASSIEGKWEWLAVASLGFVIYIASLGLASLPFVIIAEVLPQQVRAVFSTILMASLNVMSFGMLKLFPLLMESLGLYMVMWIFSGVCLVGAIIIISFIPETKRKVLN